MSGRLLATLLLVWAPSARAAEAPTPGMLQPVTALANCMAQALPDRCDTRFAARNVIIIDNFPPYLFAGPGAASRWRNQFRRHLAAGGVGNLHFRLGEPQDFSRDGKRAYFVLPTDWSGTAGPRRFEEHGAWSFVLLETSAGWRVLGYAWGVTDSKVFALP